MDEFQYDIDPSEILKKAVRRRMRIGVILVLLLPLLPIVIYFIQFSVSEFVILMTFIFFGGAGIGGLVLAGYYGMGSSLVLRNYETFKTLGQPAPMIVNKTAILNRDPVYLIGQWGSNTIFFIAFRYGERSFESKLKVPRVFWRWEYTHQIGDLKVARREGTFTIPVEEGQYLSGEGIIYSLLTDQGGGRVRFRIDFTPNQLEKIIEELKRDIQSDSYTI